MKTIQLVNSDSVAIVDDDIFEKLQSTGLRWGLAGLKKSSGQKYVVSTNRHNRLHQIRLHRFVTDFQFEIVDHIDGNPLNCQRSNLRKSSKSKNAVNVAKRFKTATSKYKGVYWSRANHKWLAQIGFNKRVIYGGYFNSEIEAAKKANALYIKYFGEHAQLNDIKETLGDISQ